MRSRRVLVISIMIFIICGIIALVLILNKGHIGNISLVAIEAVEDKKASEPITPKLTLQLDNDCLPANNKKITSGMVVTIDGEEVTDGVVFESSDTSIVKIDKNNRLIGQAEGKAKKKATYDGIEATADIKVIVPIKTISFTSTNSTIKVGKDLQMKLKVTPSNATMDTLEYSSSDETIATVNSNGIVTGIAPGKVTITVFDTYTETEKKVNLTIKK